MSYPNRGGRQRDQIKKYLQDGRALDYSDRTPDGSDRTPNTQYTGAYTQYTGAYTQYTERGGTMDDSNRTPYSQGGYTQGGYTLNNSDRTPSGRGGYTQGGYTVNNSDRTPSSRGGYTQGGYTLNNSDRTPYTEGDRGTLNNSGRSSHHHSYTTGTYTGTNEGTNYQGSNPTGSVTSGSGMSQMSSSQQFNSAQYDSSAQYDNPSSCASISGTTVADGGQGRCPYQIGFQVQNQGKQISSSKRVIHFRFGFANATSMSQCRGEEHDIVVTWSITGGKRSISMDSREIQYSAGKRANESRRADVLEASWRMSDHVYDVKCYAYKPATGSPEKRDPRWKPYTLIIDGRSFFELPQVFDLGLKGLRTAYVPVPTITSNDPTSISGLTSSMRSNQTNQSSEARHAIQSRIIEQRNLLNARKQAVAAESKNARAQNEKAHTVSANSHDTGVESAGVVSAAPSELDEVRNRKQAPPPTPASAAATQHQLGQYTGHEGIHSNNVSHIPSQQRQIKPQHNARLEQKQFQNDHAYRLPPAQPNSKQQHQIAFAPQQPPTYEEIARDILGAYDSRESMTPNLDISERTDSSYQMTRSVAGSVVSKDSTYVSKASFVPEKLNHVTKPSQKPSQAQQPPMPRGIGLLDISERTESDSSHLVVRSVAGSMVSRDSTYVSKASFVPEKVNHVTKPSQKPSQAQQPPMAPDTSGAYNGMSLDISESTGNSMVSRDSTYISKATFVPEKLNHVTKPKGVNKYGFY